MAERTILVADDTKLFRDLESLFLARCGRVITAADGAEALEAVRRERPHVVVADLSMPRMDGDALCFEMKHDPDLHETPVILVTPGELPEEHARAVRAGADDVLSKPLNRVSLIRAVNRFLAFADVQGLARVDVRVPVRLRLDQAEAWGTVRNLSRGGVFVESRQTLEPETELELEFRLPDTPVPLVPTAKVVWRRQGARGVMGGMGLRFLQLDRTAEERLEDFVYERTTPLPLPDVDAAGPSAGASQ